MTPQASTSPRRRAWAGLFLLLLFSAAVGSSLVVQLTPAVTRWVESLFHGSETATQALARRRGKDYVEAVGWISRQIPEDGVYGLIDAVTPDNGGGYWVRHDLAPRRPIYLGTLAKVRRRPASAHKMVAAGSWLVVAHAGPEPPQLWSAADFESWLERGDAP